MEINEIIWHYRFVEKLEVKHHVTTDEVEEVLRGRKKVLRVEKGNVEGEDIYLALGQTDTGRYLAIFFILKANHDTLPISVRDMDQKERRQYGRK
jgi:uncharacterized DUF497 family protein